MKRMDEPIAKYRNMLFPYAYNIIGSADDAKDIVQDVLSKHFVSKNETSNEIRNEKNYLITSVVNHAINVKNRTKKFASHLEQLPEPVATEESDLELHLKDIVSYSLLVLLEQLNVRERAVFILKEAFNYSHQEIAEVISGTAENSRKLLSRAKAKINPARKPSAKIAKGEATGYLNRYVTAISNGNVEELEALFSEDIKVVADGGTDVKVLRNLTLGRENCIVLLLEVYKKFQIGQTIRFVEINHQPAILFYTGEELNTCQVFSIASNGKVYAINSVIDPKKLKNIATRSAI
ncbi:sigma-70 family RNA polymerase sigma factor [Spongiimicrobium sp. 2-473A-2-J]|uniref:sigma-70 family RNA polymerase sigma factor n=1 Tax=Eudoraea algarum TaxID=3417568 RepID=UPI003D364F91